MRHELRGGFARINGIIGVRYWRNLNFTPRTPSEYGRVQDGRVQDACVRRYARVHPCVHLARVCNVCRRSYVHVRVPRVPVDLITTIGLTNLIDVHQLFGPFEGRLIPYPLSGNTVSQ